MSSNISNKSQQVIIESILYKQFIKYNDLDRILDPNIIFKNKATSDLNIYIDMYQMIVPIYRFQNIENPLSIASCILNMAIHYKHYMRYKFHINCHVFIMYSPTMSSNNTRFISGYNKSYTSRIMNNPTIHQIVTKNIKIMELITKYMRNIYFKTGTVEVSVMINEQIERFNRNRYDPINIIITNSQYAFQLPSIHSNTILLFRKNDKDGNDLSYLVTHENCIVKYIEEIKKINIGELNLQPQLMSAFMILSGIPKRNVKSLFSYKEAIKILSGISSFKNLVTNLSIRLKELEINKVTDDVLNGMYSCIDLNYQTLLYKYLPESQVRSYLQQLEDNDTLVRINEECFASNPIALSKL